MRTFATLGIAAALFTCSSAGAAMITALNSTWPATPDVQTIDALSVTNANRAITTTRVDRQSFQVPSDVTLNSIYLSASGYNNLAFTISFFNTTNSNGNPLTSGTQIGNTITVQPQGSTASGSRNLKIDLDPSEQFTLPAATAPAGYIMAIGLVDTTSATAAFNWVMSNTGTDIYTLGRYRRDDGDMTNTRDFGLALIGGGTPSPEPGSLSLFALGSLVLVHRRRA